MICSRNLGASALLAALFAATAAQADITPEEPFPLAGYITKEERMTTGIRDPLVARALALGAGTARIVLVSADLLVIPRTLEEAVRSALADDDCGHGNLASLETAENGVALPQASGFDDGQHGLAKPSPFVRGEHVFDLQPRPQDARLDVALREIFIAGQLA